MIRNNFTYSRKQHHSLIKRWMLIGQVTGTPVDPSVHDSFHEIEGEEPNDLCILLNVTMFEGGPPKGFTYPSLVRITQERAGVSPLGVTTLGDREAILEFAKDCEVFRIAR